MASWIKLFWGKLLLLRGLLLLINLKGTLILGSFNHSSIYFFIDSYLSSAYCMPVTELGTVCTEVGETRSLTFSGEDRFLSESYGMFGVG